MRRSVKDLLDRPPSLSEQLKLRRHFEDRCCYCGADARPREGHLDHADPAGGNGIGNFVLACGQCNGDEKRETPWREFLAVKCASDPTILGLREERIRSWLTANARARSETSDEIRAACAEVEQSIAAFELAYNKLRALVRASARR